MMGVGAEAHISGYVSMSVSRTVPRFDEREVLSSIFMIKTACAGDAPKDYGPHLRTGALSRISA